MKKSLLLAVASLAVVACAKRTIGEMPVDPSVPADNAVRFSSNVETVVSKAGLDAAGHSTFEENDEIGVYAVIHTPAAAAAGTAALGSAATIYPTNADFQYFNRQYRVTTVDPYDATTTPETPAIAHFDPVVDPAAVSPLLANNTMYYLSGGQAWNYYVYYPFSFTNQLMDASSTTDFVMPNTLALASTAANFVGKSDKSGLSAATPKTNFFDQRTLVTSTAAAPAPNAYPGPIMFAYYNKADKQAALGTRQPAVRLPFKYAVAKLTLKVKVSEDVIAVPTGTPTTNTNITQLKAIAMDGEGMYQGFKFDLTKAQAPSEATGESGVYDVITTIKDDPTNAPAMKEWTNKATFPTFSGSTPYTGYLFKVPAAAETSIKTNGILIPGTSPAEYKKATEFTVTGYLIPAGNDYDKTQAALAASQAAYSVGDLKNVFIRFYVSTQTSGANPEVYTVTLDQTKGGTVTSGTPTPKNYLPSIAPGKEYVFNITLDKNAITFEGEVEDWDVIEPAGSSTEIPAI